MKSHSEYVKDYDEAVLTLQKEDKTATIQAPFINILRLDDKALAKKTTDAQVENLKIATEASIHLVHALTFFCQVISQKKGELKQSDPQQLNNLVDAASLAYTTGKNFTNALLANGEWRLNHIHSLSNIFYYAQNVLDMPQRKDLHLRLENEIKNLHYQLETNPCLHGLYTVGRAFLGALGCLLGAAIIVAGLFSGAGLLLTLGFGFFTSGKSWGPASWGKRLCLASGGYMVSGPTSEERALATNISGQVKQIDENATELRALKGP